MKIRLGFVSNSSSSSFVCNICGEIEVVPDGSLSDSDMYKCIHDHTFCCSHKLEIPNENINYRGSHYGIKSEFCPICSFKELDDLDLICYLMKETHKTREILLAEIKNRFDTYENFNNYLEMKYE